jgi:hypothetical protein
MYRDWVSDQPRESNVFTAIDLDGQLYAYKSKAVVFRL